MKIIVASTSRAKLKACEYGFQKIFPTEVLELSGISVSSDVPDQPFGEDTFRGAENRLNHLKTTVTETGHSYDYLAALEGGISRFHNAWYVFAAVVIESRSGLRGRGASPLYTAPEYIIAQVQAGEELGHVLARYTGDPEAKQSLGTIGLLSQGRITRDEVLGEGVRIALVPFLHPELWQEQNS